MIGLVIIVMAIAIMNVLTSNKPSTLMPGSAVRKFWRRYADSE